ncbi:hypothetical protein NH340_JMT01229 [Sarcoptes scabiei]|nr:hypothetical protein NH340_JMT01229 [Sarcoptes scabiei]
MRRQFERNRLFNGPSEKKNHYIGTFLTKLSESDPKNKFFTRSEIVEVHNTLRKEATVTPWLFKFIQTIVDNGDFLDDETLKTIKNEEDVVDYSDDEIAEFQKKIEDQSELKRLIEFNQQRMSLMNKLPNGENGKTNERSINNFETVIQCQNSFSEINAICDNLIGPEHENRLIDNSLQAILTRLFIKFDHFKQSICEIISYLREDLESKFDSLTIEFLSHQYQSETNHQKSISLAEFINSNHSIKEKYLILLNLLKKLDNSLEAFIKNILIYDSHREVRNDLFVVKNRIQQKINNLINLDDSIERFQKDFEPTEPYQSLMKIVKDNEIKHSYDRIIELLQKASAKSILLQHQMES